MKIKALLITALFSLSLFCAAANAKEIDMNVSAKDVLFSLDIVKAERGEEAVSRGEFVSLVINCLNYEIEAEIDNSFEDVADNHIYAGEIYKAKLMGVISGAGGDKFRPDEPITYNAAIKIMAAALGYKRIAESYGGYPVGYSIVANDISLTKGVVQKGEEALSYEDVCKLLYNFVNCDMCIVSSTDTADNVYQKRMYGKTILSERYGLYKIEGIIKSAGNYSSAPGFTSKESTIEIDGDFYKCDVKNAEKYLGCNAVVYLEKDTDICKAVYVKNINNIYDIKGKDVISYADFTLEEWKDGDSKSKKYVFDRGFYYVKNGRSANTAPTFAGNNSDIRLIDNDHDGDIDFAIEMKYEYMQALSISTMESCIYDTIGCKKLSFLNDGNYVRRIQYEGKDIPYYQVPKGSVISYCQSDDGYFVEAWASTDIAEGVIEEIADDECVIGGVRYKVNDYFVQNAAYYVGLEGKFTLAKDKTLTGVINGASKMRYGFVIDAHIETGSISGGLSLRILDQGGQKLTYEFANRVMFNGTLTASTGGAFADTFVNQGYPEYQLIKYMLGEDGKISIVDTFSDVDESLSGEDRYEENSDGHDSLTRYINNKKSYYNGSYKTFLPYATVGDNTISFSVPENISTVDGEEGRLMRYDEKYFSVISPSSLGDRGTYIIDVYDQDKFLQPGAVVIYEKEIGKSATIPEGVVPTLVEKVVDAIDDEGNKTKKITVMSGNNYVSYYFTQDMLETLKKEGMPKSGDVIKIIKNSFDEISGVEICASYNSATGLPEIITQGKSEVYYPIHVGRIFSHNDATLSMKMISGPIYGPGGYTDPAVDSLLSFTFPGGARIYRYNVDTEKVQVLKKDDLKNSITVGENEASVIVTHSYSHNLNIVVEYVRER